MINEFLRSIPVWVLWPVLFSLYFILDGIGAKNIIATNKLDRVPAANSSAMMYLLGIIGSYVCVVVGIISAIPMILGAWAGTFSAITWEIKILKRNGRRKIVKK